MLPDDGNSQQIMVNAVRNDHHGKGEQPTGNGGGNYGPPVFRRNGDEPAHPPPEPGHDAHVEQAHDADDVSMRCFDGPFRAVVHAAHAAFAAV